MLSEIKKKYNFIILVLIFLYIFFSIYVYFVGLNYIYTTKINALIFSSIITLIPFIIRVIYIKLLKNKDNLSKKQNLCLIISSFLISLFLIYCFNIYKINIQSPVNLEISTTHTKYDKSKGYDIALYKVKFDNQIIYNFDKEGNIKREKNIINDKYIKLISEKNKISKIKKTGKADKVHLCFLADQETGIAKIKVNNNTYMIDTYQPYIDIPKNPYIAKVYSFEVNNSLSKIDKIKKYNYIFSFFLIFMMSLYYLGKIIINKNINTTNKIKSNKKSIFLYALPILYAGILYLLTFYPGIMSFDSLVQWKMAHELYFSTAHPVFHTYLIFLLTRIWDSPTIICIVQILFLAFITGYVLYKLETFNIPRSALLLTSIAIAFTPYNGIMCVSLWKDVLFSISLLTFSLLILLIILEKNNYFKSPLNIFLLICSMIFITFTRYNGICIGLITLIILYFFLKPLSKNILKSLSIFIYLSIFIIILLNQLNTEKSLVIKNQLYEVPLHQIQSVFHYNGIITIQQKEKLNNIMPVYSLETFYTKYLTHKYLHDSHILDNKEIEFKEFVPVYLDILKNNVKIMTKDWLILNSYILKYSHNPEGINYTQTPSTTIENSNYLSQMYNTQNYNFKEDSKIPFLKQLIQNMINSDNTFDLLYKPTLYFLLFLIFGTFLIIKNGIKYSVVLVPTILNILFLSVTLPEMCTRYLFILFLIYPFIILLSLVKFKEEK